MPSGVRVVTQRVPGVRSVALGFWIGTGSVAEPPEQAGISHLLEHMLFRGTRRHTSEEIDQIFDAMGAEVNAGTDSEATSLYSRVLDRNLERAFAVLGEMLVAPRLSDLEAEREVVLEEIAMYEDDPQDVAFDALGNAVFGAHPLGRAVIGSAQTVGAITHAQVTEFHARHYVPENIVIAAAGSLEHDELVRMAQELESSRAPGAAAGARGGDVPEHAFSFPPRVRFVRKDTEQYHVCFGGGGLARDDERRFALRVLEGVLGATSSSRLFQEVRERRGLAYSVYSFSSLYAHTGEVGVYVGTRPEQLGPALEVIAAELERFAREGADEQELERSRENLKGRVVLAMESTAARMNHLGGAVIVGMPILTVDELIERIDAVRAQDVAELAYSLFDPSALSVACVGPDEEAFRAAMEPLRDGAGADAREEDPARAGAR
ncbi:MAG TPA: pitrilysin family protein [Solirubrobacteraceae bacterium]|nr:pitrilysin family protein [Solirubrobacteraceae bacterium]